MSKPTASAAGDAMPAEGQKTRRAALGLFAGARARHPARHRHTLDRAAIRPDRGAPRGAGAH
jgi:hypothetical protein